MDEVHPLRKLEVRAYSNDIWGWVAFFGDGKNFPVYFRGSTEQEVTEKAEQFRRESLEKHEKAYLARRKAMVEAAERRKKKKT